MFVLMLRRELLLGIGIGLLALFGRGFAASPSEKFHEAYYLENAKGDCDAAAQLYAKIAEDATAEPKVRSDAAARLAGCREELASRDMATLMPAVCLAYVELKNPGDRLLRLLSQLGLLAGSEPASKGAGPRVAISPTVIKELVGVRGVGMAITGFDPMAQAPRGVAVINPGDLDLVRGLIETGLPSSAEIVEPIGGFPTYLVEGKAVVTLTARLVIVASDRPHIEAVIRRLNGKEKGSLASSSTFTTAVGERDDALLLFVVNAKPLMPIARGLLTMSNETAPQFNMADSLLDLDHLNALAGKISVSDAGLGMDLSLQLDEGHKNLVFNLMKTPAVSRETLKAVPEGVAFFSVGALNEAAARTAATSSGSKPQIISFLDYGREIFANITSFAVFVLPPGESGEGAGANAKSGSLPPIPDIGVVITVNDPAKSQALWAQTLGLATMATGTPGSEGNALDIEGAKVRTYGFPGGPTVHFTTSGNDVLLASSRTAITRSIQAKKSGKSVLTDAAFASAMSGLSENTEKLVALQAARAMQIGKQFIPPSEFEEVAPFAGVLTSTVASFSVEQSPTMLRLSARVTGLPNISEVVAQAMAREMRDEKEREDVARLMKNKKWDEALSKIDAQLADKPTSDLLRKKFEILAVGTKNRDAAAKVAHEFCEKSRDDANELNTFAWRLLKEDRYGLQYNDLALEMSERSNKLTDHANWMYLDTLAWAKFETGDIDAAIEWEKKAIERAAEKNRADLRNALARFEAAKGKTHVAGKQGANQGG